MATEHTPEPWYEVACVNACLDLPDPAASIERWKRIEDAAKELVRLVDADTTEPVELARCRFDELHDALKEPTDA